MSHITEIKVEGLTGRNDVYHQKLNRDINVFFGLNGSGKTSLLRIMHSAMSNDALLLESVPFKHAEVKFYSINYNKIITRRITKPNAKKTSRQTKGASTSETDYEDLWLAESSRRNLFTWKTTSKLASKEPAAFAHIYLPTTRLYIPEGSYRASHETNLSEAALDLYFATSLDRLWSKYSTDILTEVNIAQRDGLASILKAVLTTNTKSTKGNEPDSINSETAYKRVVTFLKRQGSPKIIGTPAGFKKRYQQDDRLRSVVHDINAVEKGIERAMAPRNKLESLIQNMFGDTKVIFREKSIEVVAKDKAKISLAMLSSGQKHVLKIFIETLLAEQNSLMIDEPEISTHIDWQKDLIASMRQLNPSAQLILATHSPEIMADIPDSKIFRL